MPKIGKELAKIAISKGWKEVRIKGSHHQFTKDGKTYIVTISIHGNKVVGAGLVRKNLKDLDLRRKTDVKNVSCNFSQRRRWKFLGRISRIRW